MLLEVELIRAREFIRLGPRGELDLEKSRMILQQLAEACRKRGTKRALLDVRDARSNFGPRELAACVNLFGEVGFPHIRRLALLHGTENRRRVRTFSMLASLRGWEVRAFSDFESAFEWVALAEDKPSRARRTTKKVAPGEHRIPIRYEKVTARKNSSVAKR